MRTSPTQTSLIRREASPLPPARPDSVTPDALPSRAAGTADHVTPGAAEVAAGR